MYIVVNKRTFKNPGDGAVVEICRPSPLGNPFYMKSEDMRDEVCDKYKPWLDERMKDNTPAFVELHRIEELHRKHGKVYLVCFCAPKRCHGNYIKKVLSTSMAGTIIPKCKMRIYKEKAGVISENAIWICMCGMYLYSGDTIQDLIEVLNTEWENDSHLVG